MSIGDYLKHYRRKLQEELQDVNKAALTIQKLDQLNVTPHLITNTGVYKLVRDISKSASELSEITSPLYCKWKALLLAHQNNEKKAVKNDILFPVISSEPTESRINKGATVSSNKAHGFQNMVIEIPNVHVVNNNSLYKPGMAMPTINEFPPLLDFKTIPNDMKIIENNNQKNDLGSFNGSNAQLMNSNSPASSQNSNSQPPQEVCLSNTSSPNKVKIPEPYAIEMKEGMFRVIKTDEVPPANILRIKPLYPLCLDTEETPSNDNDLEQKAKTPRKGESSPKTCKVYNDKRSEKKRSKPKNHSVDKVKKDLKSNFEKAASKSTKIKANSPLNKSSKLNSPASKSSKQNSPVNKSKLNSPANKSAKVSSPLIKTVKSNSPVNKSAMENLKSKEIQKNVKEKIKFPKLEKNSGPLQSANREDLSVVVDQHNSLSCDIKKEPGHKVCDKKIVNKVLSNDVAGKFLSSKKERTAVYSGKRAAQDVSSLKYSCIRVLRKNIDSIKSTMNVPYEQLKPVLQCCSASQLRRIEENNRYLLKYTEELWRAFCQKKFHHKPEPPETWREFYWRCRTDQERKMKTLTANISAFKSKAAPEKQVKRAIVEELPENHKSKKIKISISESDVVHKISSKQSNPSSHKHVKELEQHRHKISSKESTPIPKVQSKESAKAPLRESPSIGHKTHKESSSSSSSSAHKKVTKKGNCAPLMSKVKKTVGLLAMHKK